MITRRFLSGLLLSAPAIVAADRLMPVRSPRPLRMLSERDIDWGEQLFDFSSRLGVTMAFHRADGRLHRHAVCISLPKEFALPADPCVAEARAIARKAGLEYANAMRRAA